MRLNIQLRRYLLSLGEPAHGMIEHIRRETNLSRYQVSKLINNETSNISLDVLEEICDFLIRCHGVDPSMLPNAIFALEQDDFWTMLTSLDYIEISFGVRREKKGWEKRWVMASDCQLFGAMLQQLFGPSLLPSFSRPRSFKQSLVPAPMDPDKEVEELLRQTQVVLNDFKKRRARRALICIGSVKSNVLVESVIADLFGMAPGVHQRVKQTTKRTVPFFVKYRPEDPDVPSCHGGRALGSRVDKRPPGIYFETLGETWSCCPSHGTEDAGLIVCAYYPPLGSYEIVMGGFSGQATDWITRYLPSITRNIWPLPYNRGDLEVGVFVIRFDKAAVCSKAKDKERADPTWDVIAIDPAVLARRLGPALREP